MVNLTFILGTYKKDYVAYLDPHPLRDKAAGRPVVMLPLVLFSDDTSGNKSKKWHKFDSWSVMLAGLPHFADALIKFLLLIWHVH